MSNLSTVPFTETISGTTVPSFPGAYVFRDAYNSGSTGMIPIYTSIPNFTDIMDDKVSAVLVLPGFKIIMYENNSYAGTPTMIDNSGGNDVLSHNGTNSASSCRLYYNNSQI